MDALNKAADSADETVLDVLLDRERLREELAAAPTGPWQYTKDGAEPEIGKWYLTKWKGVRCRYTARMWTCEGEVPLKHTNLVAFAEIRTPDHIPDAGKMIEKGESDE